VRGQQLALHFERREDYCYGNYHPGPNTFALTQLQHAAATRTYLWGAAGSGKTHLLHAACRAADARQLSAIYLPLGMLAAYSPSATEGLDAWNLICLDDVDAVAGHPAWEEALYTLFNLFEGQLLLAASTPSAELSWQLPDLRSRLAGSFVLGLQALDDTDRLAALQLRARWRGFDLPPDSARYLLTHYSRATGTLCGLLDNLAQASLSAQRKITIPFIKAACGQDPS
jgi:DnaA family protein